MNFIAAANSKRDDCHHEHYLEESEGLFFFTHQLLDTSLAIRFQNIIRLLPKILQLNLGGPNDGAGGIWSVNNRDVVGPGVEGAYRHDLLCAKPARCIGIASG